MIRVLMALSLGILLFASTATAQLSPEITPIKDDPRCASALNGVTDDAAALATGCARFWAAWPPDAKATDTPEQLHERNMKVWRIQHMMNVWMNAQVFNRGHYAPTVASPAAAAAAAASQSTAASAPATGGPMSVIRPKCAKEWPDDFKMRAFCEEQQQEGYRKVQSRAMTSGDQQTIRRKCSSEWPDDFKMQDFCEEQQLEALRKLKGQ